MVQGTCSNQNKTMNITHKQAVINKLFTDVQKLNKWCLNFAQFWIAAGVWHPEDIEINRYQTKRIELGVGDDYDNFKKIAKKIWNKRDILSKEFETDPLNGTISTLLYKVCNYGASEKTRLIHKEIPKRISEILSELNKKRI